MFHSKKGSAVEQGRQRFREGRQRFREEGAESTPAPAGSLLRIEN